MTTYMPNEGVAGKTHGGHALRPHPGKGRGIASLFPSTVIGQHAINQLLAQARTQVQKRYASDPLPSQQTYLQPFADQRASNTVLAGRAADFFKGASTNAQNVAGAFTSAVAQRLAANQEATIAGGGSGIPGSLPAPAVTTIPMNMIGSSWTNFFNGLVPAQAQRAQEANDQVNVSENKALADYTAGRRKRTGDMQDAIETLYKANLSTLQASKDSDYRNALTMYALLGKEAYQKALLKQHGAEFKVTSGLRGRALDLQEARDAHTDAYRQESLNIQRAKAQTNLGFDLAPMQKLLWGEGGKSTKGTRPVVGRHYDILVTRFAPGTNVVLTTVTKHQTVKTGEQVPKNGRIGDVKQTVTPGDDVLGPAPAAGTTPRKATMAGWRAMYNAIHARRPDLTDAQIKSYMPPPPRSSGG